MEEGMKGSHGMYRWPLTSVWILAGLIGVMAFGNPQVVAAQNGSADVCDAALSFAQADQAVDRFATGSYQEQLAAQEAWHESRAALAKQLPPGEAKSAAETLHDAKTVAGDEEWSEEHKKAYQKLGKHLDERCNVQLDG